MNRPKKKKVAVAETTAAVQESTGSADAEPASCCTDQFSSPQAPDVQVAASPGKKQRLEAASAHDEAKIEYAAAQKWMAEAEAQFKLDMRIVDAKQRRYSNGFKRKPQPSAIGQIEKGYKLQLQLKDALFKRLKVEVAYEAAYAHARMPHMHLCWSFRMPACVASYGSTALRCPGVFEQAELLCMFELWHDLGW